MGNIVPFARRRGNKWWIGVMNGAKEQIVNLLFDFLKKTTNAIFICNSKVNTEIDRHERSVLPQNILTVILMPGGVFVAWL